jgi:exopolysaccharide biosynthesis polyprenyl glycosylphosphotransferase
MTLAWILFEGGLLFAAVSGAVLDRTQPVSAGSVSLALGQALAVTLCYIVAFYYNDLYDLRMVRTFGNFAVRLLQAFGVAFMLLAGFYTLLPGTRIAGGPFLASLLIILGLLLPLRATSYAAMRSRSLMERVLILGTGPLAARVAAEIQAQPQFRCVVVGVVGDLTPSAEPLDRYPHFGPIERLDKIVAEVKPDRIVVALLERRARLPLRHLLRARLEGIIVTDGVDLYEDLTGKLAIESLTPSSLIFSRDFREARFRTFIGRLVSFLVAVVGLVCLAPLMGFIALAVKLDSRGPVLFVQDRVALHGRRFKLLKFRTMHPIQGSRSEWVRDNSDRITRVGKWLRQFRLDELPQFVNMLRGDMNLVGPRPHPVSNFELFTEKIPYYGFRAAVRPGVTGWAQVRYGYANNLEEEIEKMRFDLYYIKHSSLGFDLRILFDTVKVVLLGRGSRAADVRRDHAPGEAVRS